MWRDGIPVTAGLSARFLPGNLVVIAGRVADIVEHRRGHDLSRLPDWSTLVRDLTPANTC